MFKVARTTNPRHQGDAGVGIAIAWFTTHDYRVSLPLTDSQRYDLIVDNGTLQRVQVKTATQVGPSGNYQAWIKTCGGNRSSSSSKHFDPSECEVLFIVTGDGAMYLIPTDEVRVGASITLGNSLAQFRV